MKFRPEAEIWPLMTEPQLKTLAADIDANGQAYPISLYKGDILDGRNRWLAITEYGSNGRKPEFENVDEEVRRTSAIAFVVSHNELRRHLSDSQRATAAAQALPFYELEAKKRQGTRTDLTSASIEAEVHRAADDAARAFSSSRSSIERAKRVLRKGSKSLVEAVEQGELSLGKAEEITKKYPEKRRQDAQVAKVRKSRMVSRTKGLTGEYEWYTPRKYLDAAIAVMGDIDLDPASSPKAQKHVGAKRWFTMEQDGLQQLWSGRVFLNPPYAMPFVKQFVAKMIASYEKDEISEGILLTNNATDTEWFDMAFHACTALCFTHGRIHFLEASDGEIVEKDSPTHGQVFFYFGPQYEEFDRVFAEHGNVVLPTRQLRLILSAGAA